MAKSNLSAPHFHDPDKAREYLESQVWPDGPICPHCGSLGDHYVLNGKTTRPGLYKCKDCLEPFTVTVGSLFERSKIPLNKWLMAVYLMCSSKKGISSHQLHRTLGITYKSAWFLSHRIREAMTNNPSGMLGGNGGIVEADETFWGNKKKIKRTKGRGYQHKMKIVSLVERGGNVRSFHVKRVDGKTLKPILRAHIAKDAHLMTDEHGAYHGLSKEFASHKVVNHSAGEYVRGNANTNTIEGYFSLFKRGLIGTFHHISEQHIERYAHEFDFKWNHRQVTDSERADNALKGISGKRLTYRRINQTA
ncbi:MAG TPA: IS1595 family transposase [Acidiferrobacterales bacterium]|nr:IS1595 family transposase [Acidiferrobacterales bacterium]